MRVYSAILFVAFNGITRGGKSIAEFPILFVPSRMGKAFAIFKKLLNQSYLYFHLFFSGLILSL